MPTIGRHRREVNRSSERTQTGDAPTTGAAGVLALRSPAFADHGVIPDRYTLEGANTSPPLDWSAPPEGTAELALLCEDPDAPGGPFTHWVVVAIPPDAAGIPEGRLPKGAVAGRNDFGELGWSGPRPPVGDNPHRYVFRLSALDRPLGLSEGALAAEVQAAARDHVLARGTLVGRFAR